MFEIDKKKFGTFIADLRKEKGFTQKELAQKLFISDKAVSKWETAVSIPDTALLVPLADLLGVSVTELLMCQRVEQNDPLEVSQVETVVQTAISYSEGSSPVSRQNKRKWKLYYFVSVIVCCAGLWGNHLLGGISRKILTCSIVFLFCGAYFCLFAKGKLPAYYDENHIGTFHDGPVRMNIPGLRFNNSNWPHILRIGRLWGCLSTALYPVLSAVIVCISPNLWAAVESYMALLILCSLVVPIYFAGMKYA